MPKNHVTYIKGDIDLSLQHAVDLNYGLRLTVDYVEEQDLVSRLGYISGYKSDPNVEENLIDLEKELKTLRILFPELKKADFDRSYIEKIRLGCIKLPVGVERWTLIPREKLIAPTHDEAIKRVHDLIRETRKGRFIDCCEKRKLQHDDFYLLDSTVRIFKQLGYEQKGHDILIVPAQLGLRHGGFSPRRSLAVMNALEFGADSYSSGIILLTHPDRLMNYDDLWINCPGNGFFLKNGEILFPCYRFGAFGGCIEYASYPADHASYARGASTLFYIKPQSSVASSIAIAS